MRDHAADFDRYHSHSDVPDDGPNEETLPDYLQLIGAALRAARLAARLTRADVAKAVGAMLDRKYTPGTVGRWERGETAIPATEFASVCGVTTRHLFLAAAKIELPDEPGATDH